MRDVSTDKTAVVLLTMGGPQSASEVEPFLRELFRDPTILRAPLGPFRGLLARHIAKKRAPEARAHYDRIGGGSPILANTRAQAEALRAELLRRATRPEAAPLLRVALRYTAPRAREVVAELADLGIERIVGWPMYAQACSATGRTSLEELLREVRRAGLVFAGPDWREGYPTLPGLIAAYAGPLREALAAHPKARVLFSAHGLPKRIAAQDPYPAQIAQTLSALAAYLPEGLPPLLAFQSRLGPVEWLRPYLDEEVRRLGASGVRELIVVPISFVSEHVETLYELDIELREIARAAGITTFVRLPTPGTQAEFIAGLASMLAAWI